MSEFANQHPFIILIIALSCTNAVGIIGRSWARSRRASRRGKTL